MKPDALAKLHGLYQPPLPSWLPQTMGWYVLFAVATLLLAFGAWRGWRHWRANRYRREALRELEHMDIAEVPALLKRTALAAWPRDQVASLSGERWIAFLDAHGGFSSTYGQVLLDLDYRASGTSANDEATLRRVAAEWIRNHVRA
jgi:Domain of unknown function (DUF4381)